MKTKQSIDRRRRALLRVSGMAARLAFAAQRAPALAQARSGGTPMKIGIVGSGKLGGTVGARWVKVGHELLFSSRHPDELNPLVEALEPRARTRTHPPPVPFADSLPLPL